MAYGGGIKGSIKRTIEEVNALKVIATIIMEKREKLGITRNALSRIIGVTHSTMKIYESGALIDLIKLLRIIKALDLDIKMLDPKIYNFKDFPKVRQKGYILKKDRPSSELST